MARAVLLVDPALEESPLTGSFTGAAVADTARCQWGRGLPGLDGLTEADVSGVIGPAVAVSV